MPSRFSVGQGLFSALGVLSKVCMLLFTACFMQIPFSEHLLVQGLQVPPHAHLILLSCPTVFCLLGDLACDLWCAAG